MKILKSICALVMVLFTFQMQAQTADEIVANYYENTGGKANWAKLNGIKLVGKISAQGMTIPVELVKMKDGRMYVQLEVQGMTMKQMAYDGKNLWSMNMMTQKAEKSTQEQHDAFKTTVGDFPDAFMNYKNKGYKLELLGKETKEGTECFKLKLTTKPTMVNGKEEQNHTFYYFDTETMVPIANETEIKEGPMKGKMATNTQSDYQEVEGLYFPFSQSFFGQPITFDKVIVNPEVSDADFAMPEDAATTPQK